MPRPRVLFAAAALAGLCALPARAELIVFSDGRVTKAAGYQVVDDEVEIRVRGGGSYRVAIGLVDRIVEDEVEVSEIEVREVGFDERVAYDLSYNDDRKPLFSTAYDAIISAEAKKHGVDASLVSAVIRAESNYQPRALSRKGARGLMQLMPATARRLEVRKPFDPASNVAGGVKYLKELAERFKHRPELVLAAYNAGERAVESYGGVPPYRETIGYVKKILSWWTPAVAATVPASITTASSAASPSSK
jgi:soluble lytic murein transglycosylase-like protein